VVFVIVRRVARRTQGDLRRVCLPPAIMNLRESLRRSLGSPWLRESAIQSSFLPLTCSVERAIFCRRSRKVGAARVVSGAKAICFTNRFRGLGIIIARLVCSWSLRQPQLIRSLPSRFLLAPINSFEVHCAVRAHYAPPQ